MLCWKDYTIDKAQEDNGTAQMKKYVKACFAKDNYTVLLWRSFQRTR